MAHSETRIAHSDLHLRHDTSSEPRKREARRPLRAWLQAARPLALPMVLVPLAFGQALAFSSSGQLSLRHIAFATLFGVLYQVYLLYTNDHADEDIDRTNHQRWLSGGSRVLPDGLLSSGQLLRGAHVAVAALTVLTLYLAIIEQRTWMPLALLAAILLSWAYHRRPLQLSYRGHGECLQGLGCGVLLPLVGYYLQRGSVDAFALWTLVPLYLVFHASNWLTALPDYASDKAGGKHTFVVRHGQQRTRHLVLWVLGAAYASIALFAQERPLWQLAWISLPPVMVLTALRVSGLVRSANVENFTQCKAFVSWASASQAWFLCAWMVVLCLDRAS